MINVEKNKIINEKLRELYAEYNNDFVEVHNKYYPDSKLPRINEFGIINEDQYDYDNGILVVGKETNGWSDDSFKNNFLFRGWLNDISQHGLPSGEHVSRFPTMWYNIGRWANYIYHYIFSKNDDYTQFVRQKAEALQGLAGIAFTNLNKGRGLNKSGQEFKNIVSNEPIVWELFKKEIDIINPKIVICCGIFDIVSKNVTLSDGRDENGRVFLNMPHPMNRQKTESMLISLREQLKQFRQIS